jgi:DNA-binding CsgD family transcriptional regulator
MVTGAFGIPAPSGVPIVGRVAELERTDAFLDAAGRGFSILRIHGPAGIGKSTLWRAAAERAAARGFRALASRPGEGEARISLASIGDLLERVPATVLEALPEPQRRAIEVALLREVPHGPPIPERVLATALRSALERMAADTPVVVAIDDVQWLDASSAAVLSFAARRLAGQRVGLLVAHRAGMTDPLGVDRIEAAHRDAVDVGPMSIGALHHVIRDHLRITLSRSVLARVHDAAAGNPLFALEIARILATTGVPPPGVSLPVPDDVRDAVAARVRALPDPARETLLAASAAGPVSERELERILDRSVAEDLRLADAQGIVEGGDPRGARVTFRHPLFAAAVYRSASAEERRAAHRAIADRARDPEERARHLALAASAPDPVTAAALEEAADHAAARGATGSAAELLELAWRATPPDDLAAALQRRIRLAATLHDAGDTTRARTIIDEVVTAAPPGSTRGRARLEQIRLAHTMGTLSEVEHLGAEALDDARDDARLTADIRAVLARTLPSPDASRAHATAALAILDTLADPNPAALSNALAALGGWEASQGPEGRPPATLVERALELERIHPQPRVGDRFSAALGVWLKYANDFAGARHWLDATLRAALDEGDEGTLPYVYSHLPQLDLWTGDWAAAEATARRHLELAEETGQESQRRQALYNLGLVHAHRGDEAEARAVLGAGIATAVADDDLWTEAICLAPLAVLELSLGRTAAALAALERAAAIWREFGDPTPRRHEPDLVEALVAAGDVDRAAQVAESLTARAGERHRHSMQASAARARALVAAARGDTDAASAAFDEAFAHHDAVDIPFDRARTLLALGIVRRRRRERGLARDALVAAHDIFERLGARTWAERARGELDRLGLRRGSGDELTEAELRVAEAAAAGRTNREIAAALFMSPKTVDANLGRIYRKLGIGSRAELGAWMAARGREGQT